jgi:hypothetical protein
MLAPIFLLVSCWEQGEELEKNFSGNIPLRFEKVVYKQDRQAKATNRWIVAGGRGKGVQLVCSNDIIRV